MSTSKLGYRESDLLDVGLVVQKTRKQVGTLLLLWGLIRILQLTNLQFENKLQNVGLSVVESYQMPLH